MKYVRCFKCMKKGYWVWDCKGNVLCSKCGLVGYYVLLCEW